MTKLIPAFTVAALALAGSLAAPGIAFAGFTAGTAAVSPATNGAQAVQPAAMQSNADDAKPAAPSNADPDQKEKRRNGGYDWQSYRDRYESDYRRNRGYDWQSYRDRYEPDNRRNRGYDWQSYRDRYEPDYRRYIPRRNRKDDD